MNGGPQESWAQPEGGAWRTVRTFTLTGGRTRPSRDVFTLITLVTTLDLPLPSVGHGLQPEHLRILRMCTQPLAVAEISAHLHLPVSVTTILLSDLLDQDRIFARPPIHVAESPQIALLKRVRNGLARL
ncbi:DUF742 domain-containing protein [Streptomyces caeruleatus]|uniref:DUF742 domain-containing protein n=1 Tax=Streptomyces caeruleatus TaxID=661399 RepID=A0A101THQ5_9ACTN|nr:DUF742 domain-containing protein [Streptomyces caeruleatus]KUN92524.1 hypothetical protein AQJ67_40285 [Streptomyces caeruleatus]